MKKCVKAECRKEALFKSNYCEEHQPAQESRFLVDIPKLSVKTVLFAQLSIYLVIVMTVVLEILRSIFKG